MTIREKIEQVQAAHKVLQPYVREEEYTAYLSGLIDAYAIQVDEKADKQLDNQEESNEHTT